MSLDATARETNFRDSVRYYLINSIKTTEGIDVTFDTSLKKPDFTDKKVVRWVAVKWGPFEMDTMSTAIVEIKPSTRQDNDSWRLTNLRDIVMGYLIDTVNGMGKKIPFYQSAPGGVGNWTRIGGIVVQDVIESLENTAEDGTKFKTLTTRMRFASKC